MAHRPLSELHLDLQAAAKQVIVGGRYAHYKHPELPYTVTDLVIVEATDEVAVVYMVEENGAKVSFVRPLGSWLEKVEWQGEIVPRFKPL